MQIVGDYDFIVVESSIIELSCGCSQFQLLGYPKGYLHKEIRVRWWHTICQECYEQGRHNFDRQPKANWVKGK